MTATDKANRTTSLDKIFAGSSEMSALMRVRDWHESPLGPVESWSSTLRATLNVVLNAQAPMFILWSPGLTTFYNDSCLDLLGELGHPDALGQSGPIVWADIWESLGPVVDRVRTTGQPDTAKDVHLPALGERDKETICSFSFSPMHEEDGSIAGLFCLCMVTDLTVQEQAALLRRSKHRFRQMAESNMIGVMSFDVSGGLSYVNDYVTDLLGYSMEELTSVPMGWDKLTPPELEALDQQAIARLREQGACLPYEKVFLHKNGRRIPVLVAGSLVEEPFESTQEGIAFVLDLSELRQAKDERDNFFALSPDMVAIGEIADGGLSDTFSHVNRAWETLTGFSYEEMTTQPFIDFVHPDDVETTIEAAQSILRGNHLVNFENRYRCKDGSYLWLSWNVTTLTERPQFFAIARNISASKAAAMEREKLLAKAQSARDAAERANRIKDEFLAVVSHELRSPLNPILGWSQILKHKNIGPEKTKVALDTIERNARLQLQLIGDLLDISRVLRGKLSLQLASVNLKNVATNALETVQQQANANAIEIETQLSDCTVSGDAGRLQQIVWNLLTNAVKFTPEGGQVRLVVSSEHDESANAESAVIRVSDTGKGISKAFLPNVFEHFRQEDYSTTRQFGGLGLGLAIVQQIVEMHDGTVSVESAGEGKGSTFTVRLPLVPAPQARDSQTRSTRIGDLSGVRILLVEDDPDSQEITRYVLELANATVSTVSSGTDALKALDTDVPDIILSDIGMPDMDGYTLISRIRARSPQKGREVCAIALTAYASDGDQQLAIEAGFQQHLTKPFDPDTLVQSIQQLVNSNDLSM